jgi:hypothetical protein
VLGAPAKEVLGAPALGKLVSPAPELDAPALPTGVPVPPASPPAVSELPPQATNVATPLKKKTILAAASFIGSSALLRGGRRKLV